MEIWIKYLDKKYVIGSNVFNRLTYILKEWNFEYDNADVIELSANEFKSLKTMAYNLKNITDYGTFVIDFNSLDFYVNKLEFNRKYTININYRLKFEYPIFSNELNFLDRNYDLKSLNKIFNQLNIKEGIKLVFEKELPLVIMQSNIFYVIANLIV